MTTQFSCSHWATEEDGDGNYVALKRQSAVKKNVDTPIVV